MHVRVLGVDGTGAAMVGKNAGVLFFVGLDDAGAVDQVGKVAPAREEHRRDAAF